MIEIITDLRKQAEPKLTFGGVDPNTSGKKSFEVSSDGQVHYDANNEQQKNRLNVTFGGQNSHKFVPQNSNQNSQMPSFGSGGSNPPKDLKKILQSLGNSNQNSQMPSFGSGSSNSPKDLKKILQSLGNSRGAK